MIDHGSTDTSKRDEVIDRCSAQVASLSVELADMSEALLEEIERDRKLMGGIKRRDQKIEAQERRLNELEQQVKDQNKTIADRESEIRAFQESLETSMTELEAYRAVIYPKGFSRFLPVRLRGKNVPGSLLAVKQQYWKLRSQFRKKEIR